MSVRYRCLLCCVAVLAGGAAWQGPLSAAPASAPLPVLQPGARPQPGVQATPRPHLGLRNQPLPPGCSAEEGGVLAAARWFYGLWVCAGRGWLVLEKVLPEGGNPPVAQVVDERPLPIPGLRPTPKGEPGRPRSMDFLPCVKKGTEQFVLAAAVSRARPGGAGRDIVGWEGAWGFGLDHGQITTAYPGELACELGLPVAAKPDSHAATVERPAQHFLR